MYMQGSVLICVGGKKMVSDARYSSTLVTAKGGQMSVNCNDQWSPGNTLRSPPTNQSRMVLQIYYPIRNTTTKFNLKACLHG